MMGCVVDQCRLIEVPIVFGWNRPYTGFAPKGRREEVVATRNGFVSSFSTLEAL
jgi:hypothetical protein